jgi:riboflavin synthase
VDGVGRVISVKKYGEATLLGFEASPRIVHYVVEKGFIAVDGVSLTVANKDSGTFMVSIVGYTLNHTTLGEKKAGAPVNLEIDIIAKYVKQLGQVRHTGITGSYLQEHGFLAG